MTDVVADLTRTRLGRVPHHESARPAPAPEGFGESLIGALGRTGDDASGDGPDGDAPAGGDTGTPTPDSPARPTQAPAGERLTRAAQSAFARLTERGVWHHALTAPTDEAGIPADQMTPDDLLADGVDGVGASTEDAAAPSGGSTAVDPTASVAAGLVAPVTTASVAATPVVDGDASSAVADTRSDIPAVTSTSDMGSAARSSAVPGDSAAKSAPTAVAWQVADVPASPSSPSRPDAFVDGGAFATPATAHAGGADAGTPTGVDQATPNGVGPAPAATGTPQIGDSQAADTAGPEMVQAYAVQADGTVRAVPVEVPATGTASTSTSASTSAGAGAAGAATASALSIPTDGQDESANPIGAQSGSGATDAVAGSPARTQGSAQGAPGQAAAPTGVPISQIPAEVGVVATAMAPASGAAPATPDASEVPTSTPGAAVQSAMSAAPAGAVAPPPDPASAPSGDGTSAPIIPAAPTPGGSVPSPAAGSAAPTVTASADPAVTATADPAVTATDDPAAPGITTGTPAPTLDETESRPVDARPALPPNLPRLQPLTDEAARGDVPETRVEAPSADVTTAPAAASNERATAFSDLADEGANRDGGQPGGQNPRGDTAPVPGRDVPAAGSERTFATSGAGRASAATAPASSGPSTPAPVDAQIMRGITPMLRGDDGLRQITLQLAPAHLGRVSITLEMRGGEVQIAMQAAESSARQLLRENVDQLRTQLTDMGLTPLAVDVDSRGHADGGRETWDEVAAQQAAFRRAAERSTGPAFTLPGVPTTPAPTPTAEPTARPSGGHRP